MKTYNKIISTIVWILIVLILWQAASYILSDVIHDPLAAKKLPGLASVFTSFCENRGELFRQAGATMTYAAAGFAAGAAIGIFFAVIMSLSRTVELTLQPYLLISQMIPILGLAPIVFGLFKDISASRVAIAAYITFFPVTINLLAGIKSVDESYLTMMRANASGRFALYKKLLLPGSLPQLFTGLKTAAPMAAAAAILVDTLSAKDGIGYIIIFTLYGGGTSGLFWPAVITAAFLGLGSFIIVSAAEHILLSALHIKRRA